MTWATARASDGPSNSPGNALRDPCLSANRRIARIRQLFISEAISALLPIDVIRVSSNIRSNALRAKGSSASNE